MFWHNFKYSFNALFKNKALIFWAFAFPIILGTFFNLAFSDIEKNELLEVFDIAIVEEEEKEENDIFKKAIEELSIEDDENQLFDTEFTDLKKAEELLKNDEIVGYIILKEEPKIVVKSSGINETILKTVVEEITTTSEVIETVIEENIKNLDVRDENFTQKLERIASEAKEQFSNARVNIEDISSSNLSYTTIEFYTLIAMACLYGGILGMSAINNVLANMSNKGKRVAVSPTPKWKLVLTSALAGYVAQLIGLALLFIYTIFVLNVDFGDNLALLVILSLVGSLAGLSIGLAVSTLIKSNENLKTGIIISVTMMGCFLSGMMGITMKYIIDKNIPVLNIINPANMITDGFYSLYYYSTYDRYYFNLISLVIFSGVLIIASIWALRRQKYDSI